MNARDPLQPITRDEADALLVKLQASAVEAQIVRVERP